jgi:hypothetical protein
MDNEVGEETYRQKIRLHLSDLCYNAACKNH